MPSIDCGGRTPLPIPEPPNGSPVAANSSLLDGEDSLAGAQVKLRVVIDTSSAGTVRLALPLGDTPSTHIIKPELARFPGLAENEAWCMALARHIGLDACDAWEERIGDVPCLIAKR